MKKSGNFPDFFYSILSNLEMYLPCGCYSGDRFTSFDDPLKPDRWVN